MTGAELRATRDTVPFRPFTIHTANGRSFRVRHRDYLMISPNGRTAIVYATDDASSIIDVMLITELTVESPVEQPQANGDATS
jgi:hypothetical protein